MSYPPVRGVGEKGVCCLGGERSHRDPSFLQKRSKNRVRPAAVQPDSDKHQTLTFLLQHDQLPRPLQAAASPSAFLYQDSVVFSHSANSFFLRRWLVWEEHPNHCIQPINPKSQINNEQ